MLRWRQGNKGHLVHTHADPAAQPAASAAAALSWQAKSADAATAPGSGHCRGTSFPRVCVCDCQALARPERFHMYAVGACLHDVTQETATAVAATIALGLPASVALDDALDKLQGRVAQITNTDANGVRCHVARPAPGAAPTPGNSTKRPAVIVIHQVHDGWWTWWVMHRRSFLAAMIGL